MSNTPLPYEGAGLARNHVHAESHAWACSPNSAILPVRPGAHPSGRPCQRAAHHAPVAQPDRVVASEAIGRGFESLRARHFPRLSTRLLPWPNIARGVRTVIGKSQWVIVYFVQPTNRPYCEP